MFTHGGRNHSDPRTSTASRSFVQPFLLKHSAESPGFRNAGPCAYKPAARRRPGERQQHMVFPGGHPSNHCPYSRLPNCGNGTSYQNKKLQRHDTSAKATHKNMNWTKGLGRIPKENVYVKYCL